MINTHRRSLPLATAHPALCRPVPDDRIPRSVEPEDVDDTLDAPELLRLGPRLWQPEQRNVCETLLDRQALVQEVVLAHKGHPPLHRLVHLRSVEENRAFDPDAPAASPADDLEEGALPGPARAHQRNDFAGTDAPVHLMQNLPELGGSPRAELREE